jgi:predicted unusual protein kinase regulating ubiquinone biosynthesis (AarF/ABC1/UbiB family)
LRKIVISKEIIDHIAALLKNRADIWFSEPEEKACSSGTCAQVVAARFQKGERHP